MSTLLYCLGEEADPVLKSTDITTDERGSYYIVIEKLEAYFKVRRNVIFERARFNRRNQEEGESAEQYIMEIHRLANNCDYGAMKEEMIRDRLVVRIRDSRLSETLQLDAKLTLGGAKKKIRQFEAVREQQLELKEGESNSSLYEVKFRQGRSYNRLSTHREAEIGLPKRENVYKM